MKESVYLDSTIPSFYFDEREAFAGWIETTKTWWNEESGYFECFISDAVIEELRTGEFPRQNEIIEFIKPLSVLPNLPEIEEIAAYYVANFVMPQSLIGDALHLAHASYYDVQYLLTWNCKHLANARKIRHIVTINDRLGISTPQITTPLTLSSEHR